MDRKEIYEKLIERVKWMRCNEESATFETYEVTLYEKVSALTDAVDAGMIGLSEAKRHLDRYIATLKPSEGIIRY